MKLKCQKCQPKDPGLNVELDAAAVYGLVCKPSYTGPKLLKLSRMLQPSAKSIVYSFWLVPEPTKCLLLPEFSRKRRTTYLVGQLGPFHLNR